MRRITCHRGQLQVMGEQESGGGVATFTTGLGALDELCGGFARGAIHEVLSAAENGPAWFVALLLARAGMGEGAIVWCDAKGQLYPPAVAEAGLRLDRMLRLRAKEGKEELWAIAECLRCRGVGATVATVGRLTQIEARRLQLAAERGGGVGILLRRRGRESECYAAATRWGVEPTPGDRLLQRWKVQLLHGQGRHVGRAVYLEHCRETHSVRAVDELAHRSVAAAGITLSA